MTNARPVKEPQANGNPAPPARADAVKIRKNKPLPNGLVYWDEDEDDAMPANDATGADGRELDQLRNENAELRNAVTELQQLVEEAAGGEQAWQDQQREFESLLEEKSEVIRSLHQKLKEYQDRPEPKPVPREEELIGLSDELERERCNLQQERREFERERNQLKEDEDALMQQMREMEVSMSRERAELARQRSELQRLHGEIRHELEMAARDGALRERLAPLQRRHQDMLHRKGAAPAQRREASQALEPPPVMQEEKKDSSLFKRLFNK